MDSITPLLIHKALDGLIARQEATAQNIANANSPGYRPVRVTFEQSLRSAAQQGQEAIRQVRPQTELAPVPLTGTEMRLDLELAESAQTAMRYAALLNILEGRGAMMRSVIAGGR